MKIRRIRLQMTKENFKNYTLGWLIGTKLRTFFNMI